jgi:uncharacterized protein YcfJ
MKRIVFVLALIISALLSNVNVQAQSRMSSQAKGAIIGGAGGALLGGLIGKDLKGALIGAAVGAGGGYIVGNEHRRAVQKRQAAYRTGYNNGYYTRYEGRPRTTHVYRTTYHR